MSNILKLQYSKLPNNFSILSLKNLIRKNITNLYTRTVLLLNVAFHEYRNFKNVVAYNG